MSIAPKFSTKWNIKQWLFCILTFIQCHIATTINGYVAMQHSLKFMFIIIHDALSHCNVNKNPCHITRFLNNNVASHFLTIIWHLLIIVSQWWSFCIVTFIKWQEQSMWHCNNNQWLCCNVTFTKVHVALRHVVMLLCDIGKSIIVLSSILYEEHWDLQSFFKTKFSIVEWCKHLKYFFCFSAILDFP